jgi:hypothetical protein
MGAPVWYGEKMDKDTDQYSEAEAERRRDRTLQTMLRTKPQPNWRPKNVSPHTTRAMPRKPRKKAKAPASATANSERI